MVESALGTGQRWGTSKPRRRARSPSGISLGRVKIREIGDRSAVKVHVPGLFLQRNTVRCGRATGREGDRELFGRPFAIVRMQPLP
jgi:hypothetical protein